MIANRASVTARRGPWRASLLGAAILAIGACVTTSVSGSVTSSSEGRVAEESVIRQVNEIVRGVEALEDGQAPRPKAVATVPPARPKVGEMPGVGKIRELETKLARTESKLSESKDAYRELGKKLDTAEKGHRKTRSEFSDSRAQVERMAKDLDKRSSEVEKLRAGLAAEREKARAAVVRADAVTSQLEDQRKAHEKEFDRLLASAKTGDGPTVDLREIKRLRNAAGAAKAAEEEAKQALALAHSDVGKKSDEIAVLEAQVKKLAAQASDAETMRERSDRRNEDRIKALEEEIAVARRRTSELEKQLAAGAIESTPVAAATGASKPVPRELEREKGALIKRVNDLEHDLEKAREEIEERQRKLAALLNDPPREGDGWLARRARNQRAERIAGEESRIEALKSTEEKLLASLKDARARATDVDQAVEAWSTETHAAASPETAEMTEVGDTGQDAKWEVTLRPGLILNVTVSVLGNQEIAEHMTRIDPGGFSEFPLVGQVKTTGLTVRQLVDQLEESYGKFYRHPSVNLNFAVDENDSATFPWGYVTVLGRIRSPGRINLPPSQQLTLSMAIQAAGGFDTSAKTKAIRITRQGDGDEPESITVNMKNLGKTGASEGDIRLLNGDMVYVPERLL